MIYTSEENKIYFYVAFVSCTHYSILKIKQDRRLTVNCFYNEPADDKPGGQTGRSLTEGKGGEGCAREMSDQRAWGYYNATRGKGEGSLIDHDGVEKARQGMQAFVLCS